jgi:nucleoid-associated protein YgaU
MMAEMDEEKQRMMGMRRDAPKPKTEILAEHTVGGGDTLGGIALKYYGSAIKDKWMVIYEANKDIIGDNPNKLKRGLVLKIPKLPE